MRFDTRSKPFHVLTLAVPSTIRFGVRVHGRAFSFIFFFHCIVLPAPKFNFHQIENWQFCSIFLPFDMIPFTWNEILSWCKLFHRPESWKRDEEKNCDRNPMWSHSKTGQWLWWKSRTDKSKMFHINATHRLINGSNNLSRKLTL